MKKTAKKKRVSKAAKAGSEARARVKICDHIEAATVEIDKVQQYLKSIPGTTQAREKARRAMKAMDALLEKCG